MTAGLVIDPGVAAVMAVIGLGTLLALVRLAIGPTLLDRVVALDVILNLTVGAIAVCTVAFERAELLQPALVLALVAFVSTVAFAHHVERRSR